MKLKILLCVCLLFPVFILTVSRCCASDTISEKAVEVIQHFRDYSSGIKTLKISTLSTDIKGEGVSGAGIRYNAVIDFIHQRGKTLYHKDNEREQSLTEELISGGIPLVLYHGKNLLATHDDGIQIVLRKASENRWADFIGLQFLGHIFFSESENAQVAFWDIVDGMVVSDVREARLESGEEIVTIVLSANKRKVELCLIPSKKWAPQTIYWEQEPFSPMVPCLRSTKLVYSDHTLVSNYWIPMSCTVETSFSSAAVTTPDGRKFESPPVTSENRIDIVDIVVNPSLKEKDFLFSISVPDFTPVVVEDESKQHIKHIWLDGKVVPWTDETALAYVRGHKFMPGPDSPLFWIMAIGIALIVIALSRMAYRHFMNKE